MKTQILDNLARIISFLVNPLFILFPLPYLLVYHYSNNHLSAIKWNIFSLFFFLLIGVFVLYEVKHHVFSDMDISRREQRPLLFAVLSLITIIYYFSLIILKAPAILFVTVWGIMVGIVLVTFVNIKIKSSIHIAVLTIVIFILIRLYNLTLLSLLLIPIVGWARIRIKRHTLTEVIAGFILAVILSIIMYFLLKYIPV